MCIINSEFAKNDMDDIQDNNSETQMNSDDIADESAAKEEVQSAEAEATADEAAAKPSTKEEPAKEEKTASKAKLQKLSPEQMALPWYAVHTYSGFEAKVKVTLEDKLRTCKPSTAMKFGNIIIPQESVEELVRGKKKVINKKVYPGYIMVQMHIDDETWHIINSIPKISGFVGNSRNPMPLTDQEVHDLLCHLDGTPVSKSKAKVNFEEGDQVKVIDGPFAEFSATVETVNLDKSKLKVLISIFGRSTPVELDFNQVEKL